ncbi:MAG: XTP/dITP diphosphatase [Candidatus Methanofastidiosia archaeon]
MLTFVTQNPHKFQEVKAILGKALRHEDISYPEIQAESLEEVALHSANFLKKKLKEPFFIEDAGLFISSLKGFPGPYSRYVFETLSCSGILRLLQGEKKRDAHFKSVVVLVEDEVKLFSSKVQGRIVNEERGNFGFGFDPIFSPKEGKKTFGEMPLEEKNLYSHRAKALKELKNYLKRR